MERYQVASEVVMRNIGNRTLLIPINGKYSSNGYTIELNGTGRLIWERVHTKSSFSVNELAHILTEEYEIDFNTATKDAVEFLETLVKIELLSLVEA